MGLYIHILLSGAVILFRYLGVEAVSHEEVCYPPLGCFPNDAPWSTPARPMPPPASPQDIATRFLLFTRVRPAATFTLRTVPENSLQGSDFSAARRTVFIVHGFTERGGIPWVHRMKDALLKRVDTNVFITDWGLGSFEIGNYLQASANARVVGAQIARLIQQLYEEYGVNPRNVHIIGFSLGAQIAGYAGKALNGMLGKITGLDPAQPGFEGFDKSVRLTSEDAQFVEIIHTNARPLVPFFGFGLINPAGHVDFYINNGAYQPGCELPIDLPSPPKSLEDFAFFSWDVMQRVIACDHDRSHKIYMHALDPSCIFWGHKSTDAEKYLTRPCTLDTCVKLNLDTNKNTRRGVYVVPTTAVAPFCFSDPNTELQAARTALGGLFDLRQKLLDPLTKAVGEIASHIPILGTLLGG